MHNHLIIGISGQDGAYLAAHLLQAGQRVIGTSRSSSPSQLPNLVRLGICSDVPVTTCHPADEATLSEIIDKHSVDRIYLLSGQSSVGLSFTEPVETYRGLVTPALTILDLIRRRFPATRLLYAGSGEVFSPDDGMPFTEHSKHSPKSPYAAAKSAAMTLVDTYRDVYKVFASNAILFNHESPLRPSTFVIPKIVAAAVRVANGSLERLPLGNIDIARDWGWAPDYVEAMCRIIEHGTASNFIVATGRTESIRYAIDLVGRRLGVNLIDRCDLSPALLRPCDAPTVIASPAKIAATLGWRARTAFPAMISLLCDAAVGTSS
jgi:GDPmannose 4,6-dehydratase